MRNPASGVRGVGVEGVAAKGGEREHGWHRYALAALSIVVVGVAIRVAMIDKQLNDTTRMGKGVAGSLRKYLSEGAMKEDLLSTVAYEEPRSCLLAASKRPAAEDERLHVFQSQDTVDDECGMDAMDRVRYAGMCGVWAHLLELNPSSRVCVNVKSGVDAIEIPVSACLWARRGFVWSQRCVNTTCEAPMRCEEHAHARSRVVPACWHHDRQYTYQETEWGSAAQLDRFTAQGMCHAPVFDAGDLLSHGLQRRIVFATNTEENTVVFGPSAVFVMVFGDTIASPYETDRYSVPVEPRNAISDQSSNTHLTVTVDDGDNGGNLQFTVHGWADRFALRLANDSVVTNAHLSRSVPSFVCDRTGAVRVVDETARVVVGAETGVQVLGGYKLAWDALDKKLVQTRGVDVVENLLECVYSVGTERKLVSYPRPP